MSAWLVLLAPLTLGQVLDGLDTHPELQSADAKVAEARAKQRKADGAFDTYTSAYGKAYPTGKNQRQLMGVTVEQPTALWGAQLSAGWRRGVGEVPPYEGEEATVDGGELTIGLRLPLLQGRGTDPARTNRRRARLDQTTAQAMRTEKRRGLTLKAADAYWKWVAAGHALIAYEELVSAARIRDDAMTIRTEAGDAAPVMRLETQRALLKREAQRIKAQRKVAKTAIKLGMYWPGTMPVEGELSPLPAPGPLQAPTGTAPAIEALRVMARRASIEAAQGENDQLPRLDLEAMAVRPLGDEKSEMAAGLKFSLPLQRRKATGEAQRAQAEARRLEADAQWLQAQIDAEIADARSAAFAAAAQVKAARSAADAAKAVVVATRQRAEAGDTELLSVNLREQAATEAEVAWIEAKAEWHIAAARLRFARGIAPQGAAGTAAP